jgi:hypothetical protein
MVKHQVFLHYQQLMVPILKHLTGLLLVVEKEDDQGLAMVKAAAPAAEVLVIPLVTTIQEAQARNQPVPQADLETTAVLEVLVPVTIKELVEAEVLELPEEIDLEVPAEQEVLAENIVLLELQ